jgi:hypothetical protein
MSHVEGVPGIDPTRPHPARIYDYGIGGKNHFAVDRVVADQVLAGMPTARTVARENRRFLGRAVGFLAAEAGIRQFLDIGSGLLDALPSGSYLVATHTTAEHDPDGWEAVSKAYSSAAIQGQLRDCGDFARLAFGGLEFAAPGVVLVSQWRPDDAGPRPSAAEVSCYGGVAAKP